MLKTVHSQPKNPPSLVTEAVAFVLLASMCCFIAGIASSSSSYPAKLKLRRSRAEIKVKAEGKPRKCLRGSFLRILKSEFWKDDDEESHLSGLTVIGGTLKPWARFGKLQVKANLTFS